MGTTGCTCRHQPHVQIRNENTGPEEMPQASIEADSLVEFLNMHFAEVGLQMSWWPQTYRPTRKTPHQCSSYLSSRLMQGHTWRTAG